MKTYKAVVTHRKEITHNTLEIGFKRPPGFSFKAGQYIQISIPTMPYKDHAGNSRVFSIVTSPEDIKKLSIAFRRSTSAFKRSIESMPLGTEITIQGPYGHIALENELARPLVCLAGGIGITPCLSMLRSAQDNGFSTPITLVYANADHQSAAYLSELEKMNKQNKWFTLQTIYGIIDYRTIYDIATKNDDSVFMIAGPPGMVEHMRNLLYQSGVDDHRVYYEEFVGY